MPIRATIMLADSAQAVGGKLYVLGGGWNMVRGPVSSALAVLFTVSWDLANIRHNWRIELVDSDNRAVALQQPGTEEPQPVYVEGELEIGRPAGYPPGADLVSPIAVQLGPLPLPQGRYVWRLLIDGEEPDETARAAFTVMSPQQTV
jgi:hypothetical protein